MSYHTGNNNNNNRSSQQRSTPPASTSPVTPQPSSTPAYTPPTRSVSRATTQPVSTPAVTPTRTPATSQSFVSSREPFAVNGYYPLYRTPNAAVQNSPNPNLVRDGETTLGYHVHVLNGVAYYMPNGLDSIGEQFHGNYTPLTQRSGVGGGGGLGTQEPPDRPTTEPPGGGIFEPRPDKPTEQSIPGICFGEVNWRMMFIVYKGEHTKAHPICDSGLQFTGINVRIQYLLKSAECVDEADLRGIRMNREFANCRRSSDGTTIDGDPNFNDQWYREGIGWNWKGCKSGETPCDCGTPAGQKPCWEKKDPGERFGPFPGRPYAPEFGAEPNTWEGTIPVPRGLCVPKVDDDGRPVFDPNYPDDDWGSLPFDTMETIYEYNKEFLNGLLDFMECCDCRENQLINFGLRSGNTNQSDRNPPREVTSTGQQIQPRNNARTYENGKQIPGNFPAAYQNSLNKAGPSGQKCGNCKLFNQKNGYCSAWKATANKNYWCQSYVPYVNITMNGAAVSSSGGVFSLRDSNNKLITYKKGTTVVYDGELYEVTKTVFGQIPDKSSSFVKITNIDDNVIDGGSFGNSSSSSSSSNSNSRGRRSSSSSSGGGY